MRTDTQSTRLDVDREHAFRFLGDAENLPRWAVGFCRSIARRGDAWIVQTGGGEVGLRMDTDERTGVIDFHMSPAPGVEVSAFSRVVPLGDAALYVFTQVQPPGMPDDVFAGQVMALAEELEVLRHVIRAQVACAR
jgi:hypothetical protein